MELKLADFLADLAPELPAAALEGMLYRLTYTENRTEMTFHVRYDQVLDAETMFAPATPISASRASPGPLTMHPMTAILMSLSRFATAASTSFAAFKSTEHLLRRRWWKAHWSMWRS